MKRWKQGLFIGVAAFGLAQAATAQDMTPSEELELALALEALEHSEIDNNSIADSEDELALALMLEEMERQEAEQNRRQDDTLEELGIALALEVLESSEEEVYPPVYYRGPGYVYNQRSVRYDLDEFMAAVDWSMGYNLMDPISGVRYWYDHHNNYGFNRHALIDYRDDAYCLRLSIIMEELDLFHHISRDHAYDLRKTLARRYPYCN